MNIVREAVASSNVKTVGYDRATQTLEVEFNDGSVYRYEDVTEAEHQAFADAESKGGHLARVIRPGHPSVWRRVEVKTA